MDNTWVTGRNRHRFKGSPHWSRKMDTICNMSFNNFLFQNPHYSHHPREPNIIPFHFYISMFLHVLSILPKKIVAWLNRQTSYYNYLKWKITFILNIRCFGTEASFRFDPRREKKFKCFAGYEIRSHVGAEAQPLVPGSNLKFPHSAYVVNYNLLLIEIRP